MLFDDIIVTVEGGLELCVIVFSAARLFLIVIMDESLEDFCDPLTQNTYSTFLPHLFTI